MNTINPSPMELAFRDWFNKVQPLFQMQQRTGLKISTPEQVKEIKGMLQSCFEEGWGRCIETVEVGD